MVGSKLLLNTRRAHVAGLNESKLNMTQAVSLSTFCAGPVTTTNVLANHLESSQERRNQHTSAMSIATVNSQNTPGTQHTQWVCDV